MSTIVSAGLRTNEAPYLGPEGGRPDRPTLADTCSGNLGIAKYYVILDQTCTLRKSVVNCFWEEHALPRPTGPCA